MEFMHGIKNGLDRAFMAAVDFASNAVGSVVSGGKDLITGAMAAIGVELISRDESAIVFMAPEEPASQQAAATTLPQEAIAAAVASCVSMCKNMQDSNPGELFTEKFTPMHSPAVAPSRSNGVGNAMA